MSPRDFAHAFVVLEDNTVFAYKVDNYYSPENDRGVAFDNPAIDINWQRDTYLLKLSEKDTKQPLVKDAELFDYKVNYYTQYLSN